MTADQHAHLLLADDYLGAISALLERVRGEEGPAVHAAAEVLAGQIAQDRLVHVYGPGGHSNLASQEVFFRAGGLMHVSAILDEGTLLSTGALRSMAVERPPGYGRLVIADRGSAPTTCWSWSTPTASTPP